MPSCEVFVIVGLSWLRQGPPRPPKAVSGTPPADDVRTTLQCSAPPRRADDALGGYACSTLSEFCPAAAGGDSSGFNSGFLWSVTVSASESGTSESGDP